MTSNNSKDPTAQLKETFARRARKSAVVTPTIVGIKSAPNPTLRNLQVDLNVAVLDRADYYRAKVAKEKEEIETNLRLEAEAEARAREAYEDSLRQVKASKGFWQRWPNADRDRVYYATNTADQSILQ